MKVSLVNRKFIISFRENKKRPGVIAIIQGVLEFWAINIIEHIKKERECF